MDLIERYRLGIFAMGVAAGTVPALLDGRGPRWPRDRWLGLALAAAVVIAVARGPMRPIAGVVAAAVAVVVEDDGAEPNPLGPVVHVLALASLAGVWVSVPDVEPALAIAGALTPITVVRLARGGVPGLQGTVLLALAVIGAAIAGSAGRVSAMAACASVGTVAAVPLALPRNACALPAPRVLVLVAIHLLLAVPTGRLLMQRSTGVAVLIASSSVALQLVVVGVVGRVGRRAGAGVQAASSRRK